LPISVTLPPVASCRAEKNARSCSSHYWGECEDKLDEAGRLDRPGNETLEVNEARNRIGMALDAETYGDVPTYAKPSLGPGERPLQRTPHR
jgi:hypothetical protein